MVDFTPKWTKEIACLGVEIAIENLQMNGADPHIVEEYRSRLEKIRHER